MRLDHGEAFTAAIAGLQRQFRAIQRGAKNLTGTTIKDEFTTNIHGAIAEALVAKTLGLYCNMSGADRVVADVGTNIEVRHTTLSNGGLIVKKPDKDTSKYYLVCGIYPDLRIIGWMYGKDCKQERYWVDTNKKGEKIPAPHYLVPQFDLNPELIEVTL